MGIDTSTSAIEAMLRAYEAALNASSVTDALTLYAEGGVLMPPFSPSAIDTDAIRSAY